MKLLSKIHRAFGVVSTKSLLGMFDGMNIPKSFPWNWWQQDMTPTSADFEQFPPIAACTTILSQEMSRMNLHHYRIDKDGSRELILNAPSRLFRRPNSVQTRSDFFLYMMRSLLFDGNFYAVAKRNARNEVEALWPVNPRTMWPYIEPDSGEIFYRVSKDHMMEIAQVEADTWFPQRDILHIRLFTPRHPLIGESPLTSALYPTLAGQEINKRVAAFFHNAARPSGLLRHPGRLDEPAMRRIKDRFMELTQNNHTGEPVVLQEGMEWSQMDMSAVDAELIKSYELSERQIAQIFRVPPFLLGDLQKASFNNVESLTRFFLHSGLGFYIDHIEDALTMFFNLPSDEVISFDVEEALLRADLRERGEAYAKFIQNGIATPNELRKRENLPPVKHGDEPRVQQQLVPLSYGVNLQPNGPTPAPPEEPAEPTEEQYEANVIMMERYLKQASQA